MAFRFYDLPFGRAKFRVVVCEEASITGNHFWNRGGGFIGAQGLDLLGWSSMRGSDHGAPASV